MRKEILENIVILYVEDEDVLRESAVNTISSFVQDIKEAQNGLLGLELFKKHFEDDNLPNFDIIITDINMPKMDGLEMLEKIHEIDSTIPCVVTTAYSDTEFLKKAIDLGVSGYSMKPMNLHTLLRNIINSVESRVLRKELENRNKQLEELVRQRTVELQKTIEQLKINSLKLLYEATHDHLTTLYNRQKANSEIDNEILRYKRYKHNLSIIMFDIDFFKSINDKYGHDVGDEVLINISKLAKKHIRGTDVLTRWGGEEFLIVLQETSVSNAKDIAEKLRIAIKQSRLIDKDCSIAASFGVTGIRENDNKITFLKRVDEALYEAKKQGRNIVIVK